MRIAFVAPLVTAIREPQLGGSQALLADLAAGLTARGHGVDVYAASGSFIEGARTIDAGIDPATLQDSLFRAGRESAYDHPKVRKAFAKVYDMVRASGYDVVHNHAFDPPAIERSTRMSVPVVHTLHLPPDTTIADALSAVRTEQAHITVACVSESSARGWSALTNVDAVLRNGVPTDRIPWSAEPGEGLLFAGRLSPEKGAAEAIEIAEGAERPLTLVGGAYDEDYAAALGGSGGRVAKRSRCAEHGSPPIQRVDPLPRQELWKLMASAEAVLCPVLWEEPFGLVAAEAQAAGTPVVAFDRGALRELIRDGETGALTRDVDEAVRAVKDVGRLDRRRCREHAERTLDLRLSLDAHEKLYGRITKEAAAR